MAVEATTGLTSRMNDGSKCFSYSFRPILWWFRLIGIDFIGPEFPFSPWFAYGLLCFFLNLVGDLNVLCLLTQPEFYTSILGQEVDSTTSSWNLVIDLINHAVHGVGSHLILMVVVRHRWSLLLDALRRCESQLSFRFYEQMRRLCCCGLVFIIITVREALKFVVHLYTSLLLFVIGMWAADCYFK